MKKANNLAGDVIYIYDAGERQLIEDEFGKRQL